MAYFHHMGAVTTLPLPDGRVFLFAFIAAVEKEGSHQPAAWGS
jgi:hypothetical protein